MNSNSKTEYTGHGKLAVGDGSTLSIPHIGTSYLPTCKPLILIRLFLVPSIKKNLISISKFTSDNDVIVDSGGSRNSERGKGGGGGGGANSLIN